MDQYVEDNDGGKLTIEPCPNEKITLTLESPGWAHNEVYTSRLNMVDPDELIYAIMQACGQEKVGPVTEALADQINGGIEARIDFPNGGPDEDPEKLRGKYVHTTPATAEEPRVWAGADEPIIDQLIGRVGDLEEEKERTEAHVHLARHWDRRLAVARQALSMTPVRGESKPVGIAAVFGTERSGEVSVTDALKIARFAADEDRDIPGVDK